MSQQAEMGRGIVARMKYESHAATRSDWTYSVPDAADQHMSAWANLITPLAFAAAILWIIA